MEKVLKIMFAILIAAAIIATVEAGIFSYRAYSYEFVGSLEAEVLTVDLVKKQKYVSVFPFIGYSKDVECLLISIKTDGGLFSGETNIMTLKPGDKIMIRLTIYRSGECSFKVISKIASVP